jgi:quercetin dioxygenase-like cupin family protein
MCTEAEIREMIKSLPDTPSGLLTMLEPGDFHGIVEWRVVKGKMLSFKLLDHDNCEIYHTRLSKNTEISWHTHGKYSDELIVCLSGQLTIIFDDGSHITLKETDQCNIKKQVAHMAVTGNKPCQIIAMTIPKETDG